MSSEIKTTPGGLVRLIQRRMERKDRDIKNALGTVAHAAVAMIRKRTPKAFGELRDSTHAVIDPHVETHLGMSDWMPTVAAKTIVDAPHAKAVEIGSGPHAPDIKKLTEWVKLRGMQGLTARGRLKTRWRGSKIHIAETIGLTTPFQARNVAKRLKGLEVRAARANKRKKRDAHGRYLPTDAAVKVAEAIAEGIKKRGTRPHWMVRDSIPEIAAHMGRLVRTVVKRS